MSSPDLVEVSQPFFDDLRLGEVVLKVPCLEGAFQINAPVSTPREEIAVVVGDGQIDMSRTDGQKFQIRANEPTGNSLKPTETERVTVLENWIGKLAFQRLPARRHHWRAEAEGGHLAVRDMRWFDEFVFLMAGFTGRQQDAQPKNLAPVLLRAGQGISLGGDADGQGYDGQVFDNVLALQRWHESPAPS